MRGDRTLKWIGGIVFALGAIIAIAGYSQIERYAPVDIMDTRHAREVVPGVRNELGAVLGNVMRRDRQRARARQSMQFAMPMIYIGAGVGGLGLIIFIIGVTSRRPE